MKKAYGYALVNQAIANLGHLSAIGSTFADKENQDIHAAMIEKFMLRTRLALEDAVKFLAEEDPARLN